MILFKVPLAIVASYIYAAAYKAPNPVLDQSSQKEIKRGTVIENNWSQHVCIVLGALQAFVAIAEASLILTRDTPFSPAGRLASRLFVLQGGNPTRLNLGLLHFIAGLMMIFGGLMRISTFKTLGKFFTFRVGIQKDHKLITNGLYSVVRHPAYAGVLLTQPGILLWNAASGSWVRECGILNTSRLPQEDALLKKTFGNEWEEWASRVPYRLIPGIY
ncbi:hypothetical protein BJ165DRAFT_1484449 [Panaeolus papilionaceus]|nr:hypothetical protein BJ165DRAFT_1484449 [Panaeolus papilionaceus]